VDRQTRISGGSRETEQNELAVNPNGRPALSCVVTIVTPAAKRAIADRKAFWSISFCCAGIM
jgi:hypothetical protein